MEWWEAMMNSNGPSIDSWGTPVVMRALEEELPLIIVIWERLSR